MLDGASVHYEEMSPSLLADTPAMAKQDWYAQSPKWEDTRNQLEARLYALRNARLGFWSHWGRIAENILPRRFHWLVVPNTQSVRGSAINGAIKDPTGTQAVRVCTAGMRSGLMSSSRPWFKIKSGLKNFKPDRQSDLWFEDVQDRIYRVFSGSNYYQSSTQLFEDLIVFGTAPRLLYEDKQTVIRAYNPCAGEYYLGAGADLRINSFYRTYVMTVLQVVEMFGLKNVGPDVQGLWENKGSSLEIEVIVAHAIEPNFSLEMPGMPPDLGKIPGNFAYREHYWLWGRSTPGPLSVRGFREKPFIAPRWATTSNDAYGRSPGMDALPDIMQLHLMTVRQAEAIEKMVRPPMLASLALKNQPSSILPGRVTYVEDVTKGMKSIYEINMDIQHMSALIEKIEKRVEKWFFNDLFQMMENLEGVQPRNEMEIAERRGEKLQVLGPIVEGIENELADDLRRTIAIMNRRGLLPPKPASLQGVPLEIEFDSMIAVAQRAAETASMERGIAVVTNLKQTFPDKNLEDNINLDTWLRDYLEKSSFPVKDMAGEDEVKQIRAGRQAALKKAADEAKTAQGLTHTLPAVAGAAKSASDAGIDVGGGLNSLQIAQGLTPANPASVPQG